MPSSSERRAEYNAYLNGSVWKAKRRAALTRAKGRCQVCNADKALDVHHRTYERFGGKELAADLTVLCRSCHELFHREKHLFRPPAPAKVTKLKPKPKASKPKRKGKSQSRKARRKREQESLKRAEVGRKSSLKVKDERNHGKLTKRQRELLRAQVRERAAELESGAQASAAKSGSAPRPGVQAT